MAGGADKVARLAHVVDVAENDAGSALGETAAMAWPMPWAEHLTADLAGGGGDDDYGTLQGMIVMSIAITPSLNASSLCLDMVYPGWLGDGVPAAQERLLVWLLFGLRLLSRYGGWKATGQARWGTGV